MFNAPNLPGLNGSNLTGFNGPNLPGFNGSNLTGFTGRSLPGFNGPTLPGFNGPYLPGFQTSREMRLSWVALREPERKQVYQMSSLNFASASGDRNTLGPSILTTLCHDRVIIQFK